MGGRRVRRVSSAGFGGWRQFYRSESGSSTPDIHYLTPTQDSGQCTQWTVTSRHHSFHWYPSHSLRLVTTQRPWRFTSLTHPWPRWCWAIPGSSSTTPELTGARILFPCGVRNVMRPVLCLLVPLCLVCRCRMRRWIFQTCRRSISTWRRCSVSPGLLLFLHIVPMTVP